MFRIRDIDHVVLRVSDLERMIAFYSDVLGRPRLRNAATAPGFAEAFSQVAGPK